MFQREARNPSACLHRATLALAILLMTPVIARATDFHVTMTLDLPDANPGDGVCSVSAPGISPEECTLRAAIMEANALGGPERHVIHVPAGVYALTRQTPGVGVLAGYQEDRLQLGAGFEGARGHDAWNDLDIGVDVEIVGDGEAATIIEGNPVDRVFHVLNQGPPSGSSPRFVRFADLTIREGFTMGNGAGVFLQLVGDAQFDDVTLADNRGTGFYQVDGVRLISVGGAISSQAFNLILTRCTVRNNFAVTGGGLAIFSGWAKIFDTTIEGNEARSPGSGSPGIVGGLPGMGGGIALLATDSHFSFMDLRGSTLNDNRALMGGGLGAWGGFNVVNSTFSGNSAFSFGGGAYVRTPIGGAWLSTFEFTTIAGNTAGTGGGLYRQEFRNSRLSVSRTILAGNTPANCAGAGRPFTGGYNMEDADTCGLTAPNDWTNTDPRIGTLQNNGGPTATRGLLTLSPAIDRGGQSSWRVDQRGVERPQGAAMDIGAYEVALARLRVPYRIPGRFDTLFSFSVRLDVQGTSGASLQEITPAIDGLKLSVELDKIGKTAIVSATGLKIDVNELKRKTNEKEPVLFYVGAESLFEGSEFLVVTDQRFDATLADATKLPLSKQ
jgi:hypothetical protein